MESSIVSYGRACTNCARAKAKCVIGHNGVAKCERCHRLNKDCQPSISGRRRRTNLKIPPTKTSRLEEKLDGLVSLLESASQAQAPISSSLDASVTSTDIGTSPKSLEPRLPPSGIDACINLAGIRSQSLRYVIETYANGNVGICPPVPCPKDKDDCFCSITAISNSCQTSQYSECEPSLSEANESLERFRSQMLQYFPFIVIPASLTSQELRLQRPFLWLSIMALSSKSSGRQVALGREMRKTIGQRMILEGEKNLDLLLGLIVWVAWYGSLFTQPSSKPIGTVVMQLATAALVDLGLNKPSLKEPTCMMLEYNSRGCPKPFKPSVRTMEERRAAIGCFSVSQLVSYFFQRTDTLRWTPYLDECLRMLFEQREHPGDLLLVHIVRLQLILEKVAQGPWYEGETETAGALRAPAVFYVKALQTQLQDFKNNVSPELQQNEILLLHFYNAQVNVHELALSRALFNSEDSEFHRLDFLWACLQATKNWFDLFLQLSPVLHVGFSMSTFAQIAHCLVTLYRLSTFDHPGWDLRLARQTADLSIISDQLAKTLGHVRAAAGLDSFNQEENDFFSESSRKIYIIKHWWDAKIATETKGPGNVAVDQTLVEASTDVSDDAWLKDLLGLGDYQFDQYLQS